MATDTKKDTGTYYAWSNFVSTYDEHGNPTKRIKPGEKVSQADLGVDDDEWESLVKGGAVRTQPYPDMGNYPGSPREFYVDKMQEAADGAMETAMVEHGKMIADPSANPTLEVEA